MDKNIKKDLLNISIAFLISRLIIVMFIIVNKNISFINIYDVTHYIEIAKSGYTEELLYAFLPLFPLLIKLFHFIIPSYQIVSLLLSNIFSYLSVLILYLIIRNNKNKKYIIIAYIFSPILVFQTIGYTESLYLFLTLLSYYLYINKKYLLCGIIIGLSMITRNTGIVLLGAIGLKMLYDLYKKDIKFKDIIILSIPAFIIGFSYSIYLYFTTGDFFKYISVQYTHWNKDKCNLITFLIRDIKFLVKNYQVPTYLYIFIQNWLFYFIGIILGIKYFKKEPVLSIYIIVSLLLFSTTCRNNNWTNIPSVGFFRYIFSLFPIYILPFINEEKKYNILVIALYLSLSIMNSLLVYGYAFIA